MVLRYLVLLLSCTLFLAGCASTSNDTSEPRAVQTNIPLKPNEAYLLLGLNTNFDDLHYVSIEGQSFIKITKQELLNDKYVLLKVPAGDYNFKELKILRNRSKGNTGRKVYEVEFNRGKHEEIWHFNVKPGQVNYIGHFTFQKPKSGATYIEGTFNYFQYSALELENRSAQALEYLEESYASLVQKYAPTYSGPGKDLFLDNISTLTQTGGQHD